MEITLRPYNLSDVDHFLAWANDDEVIPWSRLTHHPTKESAIRYFEEIVIPHQWYRAICLHGKPVGFILMEQGAGEAGKCRGTLGYALGRAYWGKGIMTEAVKMALVMVFNEMPDIERVEAVVNVKNVVSMRVLEKVGFLREGLLRKYIVIHGEVTDAVMFSILSTTDPIGSK